MTWRLEHDSIEITSISFKLKKFLRPFIKFWWWASSRLSILEAHILRLEGCDKFKFWLCPPSLSQEESLRGKRSASVQRCGPGCLSCIPDPDFFSSQIPDPTAEKGGEKICCLTFYYSHKFHKGKNFFLQGTKNLLGQLTKNLSILTHKLLLSSQKYGLGIKDPGSGKNLPGSGWQKSTGSRCRCGFGSESAWIRINLSCWIRIRIQEGKNDP